MVATLLDRLLDTEREYDRRARTYPDYSSRVQFTAVPAMNVVDKGRELALMLELPGVRKEDVKISVEDGVLAIMGERKAVALPEKGSWVANESWAGPFTRTVRLPREVDSSKAAADLVNGILTITLPKAEEALPREITIR